MSIDALTQIITSQHRGRPKFAALVAGLTQRIEDMRAEVAAIPAAFDLDDAVGKQLDIIGLWVGQSRTIPGILIPGFFSFEDTSVVGLTFGELGNASVGGRFHNLGEPYTSSAVLQDPEYRTVLKAKIVRNQADGSIEDAENGLAFVLSVPDDAPSKPIIIDNGDKTVTIKIPSTLITLTQLALLQNLDILPRPACTTYTIELT